MTASLQVRKREKIFSKLDADGDGVIDKTDVQHHIGGFLAKFGVPPSSPKAHELHESGDQLWQALSRLDGDGNQVITREEYVTAIDDGMVEQTYIAMNGIFFKVVDANGDGLITEEELVKATSKAGLSAKDVHAAFREIDADGDGSITRAEWDQATRDLLLSGDPKSPGSMLLGLN